MEQIYPIAPAAWLLASALAAAAQPADPMAQRIVEILSDAALWKRMSVAAYETREEFNFNRSVERFEEAISGSE